MDFLFGKPKRTGQLVAVGKDNLPRDLNIDALDSVAGILLQKYPASGDVKITHKEGSDKITIVSSGIESSDTIAQIISSSVVGGTKFLNIPEAIYPYFKSVEGELNGMSLRLEPVAEATSRGLFGKGGYRHRRRSTRRKSHRKGSRSAHRKSRRAHRKGSRSSHRKSRRQH